MIDMVPHYLYYKGEETDQNKTKKGETKMKKHTEYEYTLWIGNGRKVIETGNPELPTLSILENEDGQIKIEVRPKETEEMDITDFEFFLEELTKVKEAAEAFETILNN